MPKKPRLKGDRLYHHIYAWGNDRHPVFKCQSHYQKYLTYLELFSLRCDISVIAYALMEWHIHLFLYDKYGKLSKFMNNLHGEYARFFNKDTLKPRSINDFSKCSLEGKDSIIWSSFAWTQ